MAFPSPGTSVMPMCHDYFSLWAKSLGFETREGTTMRRECTTTAEEPPFTATTEKPARSNEDRAQPKKVSYGFVAVDDCSVRKSWRWEVFWRIWGSIRDNGSGGCQSYFPTEVRRQKYFSGMQTGFSILSWLEEKWNMVRESFSCLLFQYFLYMCIQLCHRYWLLVSVRWFMGNGVLLRDFATLRIFPKYVSWGLSWCSCG